MRRGERGDAAGTDGRWERDAMRGRTGHESDPHTQKKQKAGSPASDGAVILFSLLFSRLLVSAWQ
jgi:hypothetical protein